MAENLDMASIWLRTAISFHIVARYDNRTPISDVCNLQAVTGASARISDYNIISAIVDGFNGVPYYVERHSNCTGGPSSISKGKDHCQRHRMDSTAPFDGQVVGIAGCRLREKAPPRRRPRLCQTGYAAGPRQKGWRETLRGVKWLRYILRFRGR